MMTNKSQVMVTTGMSTVNNTDSLEKRSTLSFFEGGGGLFRATPAAYGDSQASGRIGAVAASLHHSHSHARSELRLRPTPQLTATPDP